MLCGAGALVHSAGSEAALQAGAGPLPAASSVSPRPDAQDLARELTILVKDRLSRLDEARIREGAPGRRFRRVSAWTWSYWARAAITLYRVTRDPELIELVAATIDIYCGIAEHDASIDGFGWYTQDTQTGAIYREVTIAGLVIAPMVELLIEARRDEAVAAMLGGRQGEILATVERAVAGFEPPTARTASGATT